MALFSAALDNIFQYNDNFEFSLVLKKIKSKCPSPFFTEIRLKTSDFRVYQIIEIHIIDFRMTFMQIQKRTGKYTH